MGTPSDKGNSALHDAVENGNEKRIIELRLSGADTSIKNAEGKTAKELANNAKTAALAESALPDETVKPENPGFSSPFTDHSENPTPGQAGFSAPFTQQIKNPRQAPASFPAPGSNYFNKRPQ
jgi:ankyrin repeat protein